MNAKTRKTFKPYVYQSRTAYEMKYKSIGFWFSTLGLIIGVGLISISIILMFIDMIGILKGHSGHYIGYTFGSCASSILFFGFSWIISGGFNFYLDELVERINMRDKNYQPLINTVRIELNYIVQLSNGYLFRQYQFINAKESGSDFIAIELPKGAKIVNEVNTSRENREILNNTCMFDKVDEQELLAIITPITKYHVEKAYREKIKEEEKFSENQSKLNASVTNNDIKNLPLFKSLKELENKTDQEIQQYNEDTKNILKENQKIIS